MYLLVEFTNELKLRVVDKFADDKLKEAQDMMVVCAATIARSAGPVVCECLVEEKSAYITFWNSPLEYKLEILEV